MFLPKYEKTFKLNEFYIKIGFLTYICISLCLTFLIENFLIKKMFQLILSTEQIQIKSKFENEIESLKFIDSEGDDDESFS